MPTTRLSPFGSPRSTLATRSANGARFSLSSALLDNGRSLARSGWVELLTSNPILVAWLSVRDGNAGQPPISGTCFSIELAGYSGFLGFPQVNAPWSEVTAPGASSAKRNPLSPSYALPAAAATLSWHASQRRT